MYNENIYGKCEDCGINLKPLWFVEEEIVNGIKTGRVRNAVSYLFCEKCGETCIVDDSFDGPWQYRRF